MKQLTLYIANREPIKLSYPDNIEILISILDGKVWNIDQKEPPTSIAAINDDVFEGFVFGNIINK